MFLGILIIGFCLAMTLICLVGSLIAVCRFPVSAGRYCLGIGLAILVLLELAPNLLQFMMIFGSPRSRMYSIGYPVFLTQFSFVGWIFIWIGLVQAGRWMIQKAAVGTPYRHVQRGTSLLILGLVDLIVWPVAPMVRYQSGRDLRAIEEEKLPDKQRGAILVAHRLGWIGSLLLGGGGTAARIIMFVLFFEIS
ncbi:MAG: hypothetical protein VYE64_02120 [Planctomycetota bacterium]|nr:hypothetical protein [Planctomycetota bacterium]